MVRQNEKKTMFFDTGAAAQRDQPVRLIDPSTQQPMLRAPIVRDYAEMEQRYNENLRRIREEERQKVEQMAASIPARYALMPGRILVRVRPVDKAWDAAGAVEMIADRVQMVEAHEPWGTILMVGEEVYTDYGVPLRPNPTWKPGRQVMFNPAGVTDTELVMPGSGETVKLALIGFRAVMLVDLGEPEVTKTRTLHAWWRDFKRDAIPTFARWFGADVEGGAV